MNSNAPSPGGGKMTKALDLAGNKFGRLTALSRVPNRTRHAYWLCRCDCGAEKEVRAGHLAGGRIVSCGCYRRENSKKKATIHGQSHTPEHNIWMKIIQRCYWKKDRSYPRYGGRGIDVCDRWRTSFESFFADMGERPSPQHSIDRIDNSKGYSPENCRWATSAEQARNRRSNRWVTVMGRRMTMTEFAQLTGLRVSYVHNQIAYKGRSPESVLAGARRDHHG